LEVLKAAARYRLTPGKAELDLGLDFAAACRGLAKESWRQHLAAACDAHALRHSCRLATDQHGVSSPTTTAFQVRAGPSWHRTSS
jgi:hypothetical protein